MRIAQIVSRIDESLSKPSTATANYLSESETTVVIIFTIPLRRSHVHQCSVCVQESVCLQLYHTAIKHQQRGEHAQAKDLYREILESEVLDEVGPETMGHLPSSVLVLEILSSFSSPSSSSLSSSSSSSPPPPPLVLSLPHPPPPLLLPSSSSSFSPSPSYSSPPSLPPSPSSSPSFSPSLPLLLLPLLLSLPSPPPPPSPLLLLPLPPSRQTKFLKVEAR